MGINLLNVFYYRVQVDDDFNKLCSKFNTSKTNILRNNDEIELYPGEIVKIKVNDYISYIVKPMDNLEKVANKFNVSTQEIFDYNHLETSKLFIGQQLKICKKKKEKI